jgi:hypothetical protein
MGALNLNFRDAENKLTVPDEGIEAEFSFIENELSFRDAFLQALQSIRKNTDKDIVVLFSGGADSQLTEWGFNYLGIKHRVVHQRYLYNGAYLNWEEAQFMPEETEYQDIDVLEFQKSSLFQDVFVKTWPMSVHAAIHCDIKANPETDFLVSCASPYRTYSWNFEQRPRPDLPAKCNKWLFNCANLWKNFGFEGFDYTGVFYDNGYVTYSLFDDLYKQQARGLVDKDSSCQYSKNWEVECKTAFFQHHFPEVDEKLFPKKYLNKRFPYFNELVVDEVAGLYQYEIDDEKYKIDCWSQRAYLGLDIEELFELIRGGAIFKLGRPWIKHGDELIIDTRPYHVS